MILLELARVKGSTASRSLSEARDRVRMQGEAFTLDAWMRLYAAEAGAGLLFKGWSRCLAASAGVAGGRAPLVDYVFLGSRHAACV